MATQIMSRQIFVMLPAPMASLKEAVMRSLVDCRVVDTVRCQYESADATSTLGLTAGPRADGSALCRFDMGSEGPVRVLSQTMLPRSNHRLVETQVGSQGLDRCLETVYGGRRPRVEHPEHSSQGWGSQPFHSRSKFRNRELS